MKSFLPLPLLAMTLIACGGSVSIPGITPANPQNVALQSNEGPAGTQACSQSGDISKTSDKALAQSWTSAKSSGATAGWVSAFSDTPAECANLFGGPASPDKHPKILANVVYQYKDASTAAAQWKNAVGLSGSSAPQGVSLKTGTATGLGANSESYAAASGAISIEFQAWQNKNFVVALVGFNVASSDFQSDDSKIQGRIH